MNIETKKTKTIETYEHTIKTDKHGEIICIEQYEDTELSSQIFRPKKSIHKGYESKRMVFIYYGGKLDSQKVKSDYIDGNYNLLPKQVFIKDLASFNNFDDLYCLWLSMDGNIYQLTKTTPLATIFVCELFGNNFDLDKCEQHLKEKKNIRNIRKKESPNWDICGTHSLYFDFVATAHMTASVSGLSSWDRDERLFKQLGLNEFRREVK
jgi:hypothetical protein